MVVNVDHLCPCCHGDGNFCGMCKKGIVRAPADWTGPKTKRTSGAEPTTEESLEAYDKAVNDAWDVWMKTTVAQGLLPDFIEKETAMTWAYEAGYMAGRSSK